MKKFVWIFVGVLFTQTACDLQPKILSFPDTVGDFISDRYPALLADPYAQPEIYNSAAVDYGVYASPDLYGTESNDDYVMYASIDDYAMPAQATIEPLVDVSGSENSVEQHTSNQGDYLVVPMYGDVNAGAERVDVLDVGKPNVGARVATRVELTDITVASGDTLYSLSRKYSVPVNDLAVLNNIKAPFVLSVGQKLKVPNLAGAVAGKSVSQSAGVAKEVATEKKLVAKKDTGTTAVDVKSVKSSGGTAAKKISSNPAQKLPTITARSSSKFSWPVRGKILSDYGAKSNGLFNDGINISAKQGTPVVAAENGVVAYAGNEVKGMGNLIIIQHDAGWMTVYAHMDSLNVKRGIRVKVGQKIGAVGQTGKVNSPQLHFEIRKGTKAYNPGEYLKK